jgi:GNAT superfamily N-acetyltransferase
MLCERVRNAGDPCMGEWILPEVLDEVEELTWQEDKPTALQRMLLSAVEQDRIELAVFDGSRIVGFCALAEDYDIHVGRCLTVMWDYVVPSHRGGNVGQLMLRAAMQRARQHGFAVLCYTHRTSPGTYQVKYKRLEKLYGQKS